MKIKQSYEEWINVEFPYSLIAIGARISLLSLLRSVQRRDVRHRLVETSECLVRGASDCQFIVCIIARNRAALFGDRVMPNRAALCFYNWCIAVPIRIWQNRWLSYTVIGAYSAEVEHDAPRCTVCSLCESCPPAHHRHSRLVHRAFAFCVLKLLI